MRRLHPATIIVALLPRLREAIQAALPVLIGSFAYGHGGNQDWIAVFIGSFTGIFAIGTYLTTRFDILPDHVSYKTGWIFRKDRRIPLEQIQNVNIRQNLLERVFRVATVHVETALGHGRDLKLSVLGFAEAERLREELLGAVRHESEIVAKAEGPIVSLNNHDLLFGALTENHLQQMIVGMFTIIGPGVGLVVSFSRNMPPTGAALLFAGSIMLLFLGSWLWGAGSYYLKFGGFEVHRSESAFRISYGLVNRVQMAVRPGRIELLRLTITLPQRLMQRASVHVGTAGSFGEAGVLAPVALFVDLHRAYNCATDVFPGLDIADLTWHPFHPVLYRAAAIRALITTSVLAILAAILVSSTWGAISSLGWVAIGFLGLIVLIRFTTLFLARPENGFAVTEDFLVVRQGYYHQSISVMPIERMENVAISQPFWWKKYQASKLSVQGMKHRIHAGSIPDSAIEILMHHWRTKIELREIRLGIAEVFGEVVSKDGEDPVLEQPGFDAEVPFEVQTYGGDLWSGT